MDYGYPQTCSVDVLQLYMNLGSHLETSTSKHPPPTSLKLTSQITGAIDWRREGIRYKKNEVFLDVYESVNVLLSSFGVPLRKDVSGQVVMKTFLSGMPECKLGINDKLVMEKETVHSKRPNASKKNVMPVEIDDCTFHRCVRLGKFNSDRTITFVPPDGEFELMRYRITENVNLPFKVIPVIQEEGKTRLSINLKITAMIPSRLIATNVVIKIPVPPNTARCKINPPIGTIKFEPAEKCIIWRIRQYTGNTECVLQGDADLAQGMKEKQWVRPPLSMEFQVPMFTASGLHVRFLKVLDKSSYDITKWVRYITRGGQYQYRI